MDPQKAAGHPEGGPGQDAGAAPGDRGRRRRWAIVWGAVAVLLAGGGSAWLVHGSSTSPRAQDTAGATPASASTSASPGPGASASSAPATAGTPGAGPTPSAGSPAPGPGGPVVGGPVAGGPAAHTWTVSGNRLTVWFWAGVCQTFALRTDESRADRVTVRVVADRPVPKGRVCPMLAKYQNVQAELTRPLDGRQVVDAVTGKALPEGAGPTVVPRPGAGATGEKGPR
ncbi:hypothetical protein [Peterkaempfera griseoplana]|uniref:hypothetical protein n=1 Tax=Peterkaempfera griseoplana TaxID=66896 RepID=UPI0006E1E00D|nr:hypothetical protein [Peterkaempfera griseoplana]